MGRWQGPGRAAAPSSASAALAAALPAHDGFLAARRRVFSYKPRWQARRRRLQQWRRRRRRRRRNLPASRATSARRPAHRTARPAGSRAPGRRERGARVQDGRAPAGRAGHARAEAAGARGARVGKLGARAKERAGRTRLFGSRENAVGILEPGCSRRWLSSTAAAALPDQMGLPAAARVLPQVQDLDLGENTAVTHRDDGGLCGTVLAELTENLSFGKCWKSII
ncbi:serine/arginine repetitive matrix protein 3-like [Sus scrofa]|uniref:serine/arginine repetitive matrix protein 3-like n=1 Tax=Sus scrofa TaxID=9823 RepID=UPI000A2B2090|nr:serine/arginine repetitive matrix protein 3-like [Sus scrofa]